MNGALYLFSCDLERNAAFPEGIPANITTALSGVGLVDAAVGCAEAVRQHNPSEIIFLGTCGAHEGSGLDIGAVVIANEIALGSGDVASGQMRIPAIMPATLKCNEETVERAVATFSNEGEENIGRVSSTLGITEDDRLAWELEKFDNSLAENLEAYSIVRAAGNIPVAVALYVTNIVGAGGGRNWQQNFGEGMRLLGSRIRV